MSFLSALICLLSASYLWSLQQSITWCEMYLWVNLYALLKPNASVTYWAWELSQLIILRLCVVNKKLTGQGTVYALTVGGEGENSHCIYCCCKIKIKHKAKCLQLLKRRLNTSYSLCTACPRRRKLHETEKSDTLQWYWGLNSNYCPGWTGFKFMVPLREFVIVCCTEAGIEGLICSHFWEKIVWFVLGVLGYGVV
jgi:hypothetical protein